MAAAHKGQEFVPHHQDRPTGAKPGSRDKLTVLENRAALGLELWHPADCGMEMALRDLQKWIEEHGG